MRYILYSLLLLALSQTTYAQPVINATDINPVAGDRIFNYSDSLGTTLYFSDAGLAGAAITWDFHIMPDAHSTLQFDFMPCSATAYCDSFPESNIAMLTSRHLSSGITYNIYDYFATTSSALTSLGYLVLPGTDLHYEKYRFYKTPMHYGDMYMDTFYYKTYASSVYTYDPTLIDTVQVDGYGTLILPGDTITNVLRLKRSENAAINHYEEYYWYSPAYHFFLLHITIQYDGITGAPLYNNFSYRPRFSLAGVANASEPNYMTISPNPATDRINISYELQGNAGTIVLYDAMGKIVYSEPNLSTGKHDLNIDVSGLCAGMYILQMRGAGSTVTKQLSVRH